MWVNSGGRGITDVARGGRTSVNYSSRGIDVAGGGGSVVPANFDIGGIDVARVNGGHGWQSSRSGMAGGMVGGVGSAVLANFSDLSGRLRLCLEMCRISLWSCKFRWPTHSII